MKLGSAAAEDGRATEALITALALSIIIPTYNRLPLLKEALASFVGLLNCSYEVVIVDDGSTDGTAEHLCTRASCARQSSRA